MSCLAWNCRGMAKPRAVRFLKEITSQLKPSLIFLSEILVLKNKIEKICKEIHYSGCFVVDAHGHGGGLALMWKNEGGVEIKGSCNHYIDCEVTCEQIGRWRYTGFYGCPENYRRHESWGLIRHLAGSSQLPWCILGDFNDMMFAYEKKGGRPRAKCLLDGFTGVLNECGLNEVKTIGSEFTWERSRGTVQWIQEKLDRGMANREWLNMFPAAEIKVIEVSTSDHLPLFLDLNKKMYIPKMQRFKFENVWIREDDCRKVVQDSWKQNEDWDIKLKMEYCCLRLEEWGGGKVKNMRNQIQESRKEMRKYRARRDAYGISKYNEARDGFLKLLEKQEVYWKQRSKQFWLREGDNNTKFFHKFASGRKRQNQITKLIDSGGVWREEKEEVRQVITNYFSELFQSSGNTEVLSERDVVKLVTEEHNHSLIEPVTSEEVKHAVFTMHPDKSPGLDGLNPGFFQAYWQIIGGDVVKFCQKFMSTGELPEDLNRTVVCLIPKVRNPQRMTELRPISLCNVLFRILSKVMANRLKICLPSIISEQQSAFVEGRLLTDNALIAFEVNHYIRRRTQGANGVVGLKLDVSKAYDRLEWHFLEGMLTKFGFSSIWRARIMTCIKSVSYSFLHEGEVFGKIQPSRGIRQGDPISPYLYILCAEGLSSMIKKHEEVGLMNGCRIARGAPAVTHLLFADDCYLFFKATVMEAATVKNILLRYERVSGQAINFGKSNVVFSPNTIPSRRREVCNVLQVKEISVPGNYLGLPMHIGRKKINTFNFLRDRVNQKLQSWSSKSLSKGGKLVLLKTAAQTIPNFWMQLLLIPDEVCKGIQRAMNSFWWGNGDSNRGIRWLSWEKLCTAKEGGGLGFRELGSFNIAMIAKQGWRLLNNENPLVTSIMKARYFPNCDFLQAQMGSNPSYMWRSIMASQDVISQGSRRKIGNGESTRIWKIPWLPCRESGFVTTEMPQELEHTRVVNLMETNAGSWDEDLIHDIFNERDAQLIKSIPRRLQHNEDSWFWILEDSGLFSVKSCYRRIQGEHNGLLATFWKKLWSLNLPGKVINLIWRVCKSCLPTAVELATKKVPINQQCSWCLVRREDATHVLFDCSFARLVWARVGLMEVSSDGYAGNVLDIFQHLVSICSREKLAVIGMVCWNLWNRRNRWVWDKVGISEFGLHATAMNMLSEWKKSVSERVKYHGVGSASAKTWHAPQQGWMKVNIDAAVFIESGYTGIGSVIRNENGEFVRARNQRVEALYQPREAEALSLKEALSWVKDLGYRRCVFETDAKTLADACKNAQGRTYFHSMVLSCVDLFKHYDEVLVEFVHRSANEVAHKLARAVHSMSGIQEWIDSAPEFISDVMIFDSI